MDSINILYQLKSKLPPKLWETEALDNLLDNHPYFQIGRAVKTQRLKKDRDINFHKESRKLSVLFPIRTRLYHFLNESDTEAQVDLKNPIEKEEVFLTPEEPSTELLTKSSPLPTIKKVENEIPAEQIKTDNDEDRKAVGLENEYLVEAVNQVIQLEVSSYVFDESQVDELPKKPVERTGSNQKTLSFSEWIDNDIQKESESPVSELLDKFINESPVISPLKKAEFYSPATRGKRSISEDEIPISETLAGIFAQQGNKEMAIKGYKQLMLKFPEKSIYFAALLKKQEEQQ